MNIRSLFLGAGIAFASITGCMMNAAPLSDFYKKPQKTEECSIRPEYRLGIKASYTKTKLPENTRTTCETTTKSPDGFDLRPTAGAVLSTGSWLRFFVGGEAEWSLFSKLKSRHRAYEEKDHVITSEKQSPIVFTELTQLYTIKPLVGIEARIDPFKFRVEGKIPYTLVEVESGYLRREGLDSLQSDSWKGWGQGASASAFYGKESGFRGGLFVEVEKFEPDFGKGSEIENILGFLQFEWRF